MEVGITGLSSSGKTTLFNALTGRSVEIGSFSAEAHMGIVDVPDPRLYKLSEMYSPKKTTPATVQYVDVAGLVKGGAAESRSALLAALRGVDALIHVVRAFESDTVPSPDGDIDPLRDVEDFQLELILADLDVVDRRLERMVKSLRSGDAEAIAEAAVLEKCQAALNEETGVSEIDLSTEEKSILRGFGLLTEKPMIIVINISEGAAESSALLEALKNREVATFCAEIEMEIAQLDTEDQEDFLSDMGIDEPALNRLIRVSYELLDLISFFTVGEDEVRAWTVRRGTLAPEAAGTIHSDLERGFIRAETVGYDALTECGSHIAAKEQGKLRVEGKAYEVQDGDILNIRFNV